jgi:PRTRC genetic system protein E
MDIASLARTFGEKAKRIRLDICPTGGGKLRVTLTADPASGSERNAFVPLQADGTPEEVDADLDKALPEYFSKCAPRQTNLDQIDRHIKEIERKAEADRKAKFEKKPAAKASTAEQPQTDLAAKYGAQGKKPEAPQAPDLFGGAAQPAKPEAKRPADDGTNTGITVDPESAAGDDGSDDHEESAA